MRCCAICARRCSESETAPCHLKALPILEAREAMPAAARDLIPCEQPTREVAAKRQREGVAQSPLPRNDFSAPRYGEASAAADAYGEGKRR